LGPGDVGSIGAAVLVDVAGDYVDAEIEGGVGLAGAGRIGRYAVDPGACQEIAGGVADGVGVEAEN